MDDDDDFLAGIEQFQVQSLSEGLTQYASSSSLLLSRQGTTTTSGSAALPGGVPPPPPVAGGGGIKKEKKPTTKEVKKEPPAAGASAQVDTTRKKRKRDDEETTTGGVSTSTSTTTTAAASKKSKNSRKVKAEPMDEVVLIADSEDDAVPAPTAGSGGLPPPMATAGLRAVKREPFVDPGIKAEEHKNNASANLSVKTESGTTINNEANNNAEPGEEDEDEEASLGEPDESDSEEDDDEDDDAGGGDSSDDSSWFDDDSSEEEGEEDAAGDYNPSEASREVIEFLNSHASVDPQTLPAVQPPPLLQANCKLKPFQMQGFGWMKGMEEGTFNSGSGSRHSTGKSKGGCVEDLQSQNNNNTSASSSSLPTSGNSGVPSSLTTTTATALGSDLNQVIIQTVKGGILADYMGLGKTRMMVALCETLKPERSLIDQMRGSKVRCNGTLIICPVSLMRQWHLEIMTCKATTSKPKILFYYGTTKKKKTLFDISKYDYVLTSFNTLAHELITGPAKAEAKAMNTDGASSVGATGGGGAAAVGYPRFVATTEKEHIAVRKLNRIHWHRIILDEAHTIRNSGTSFSKAVMMLEADRRWCISGTPIQNKLSDLFPLFKFLRVPHFGDATYWRENITNSTTAPGAQQRQQHQAKEKLKAVLCKLMLRRKPTTIVDNKPILVLPPKDMQSVEVVISPNERRFYEETKKNAAETINRMFMRTDAGNIARYACAFVMLIRTRQALLHGYVCVAGNSRARAKHNAEQRERVADGEALQPVPRHLMTLEEVVKEEEGLRKKMLAEKARKAAKAAKEEEKRQEEEAARQADMASAVKGIDKELAAIVAQLNKSLKNAPKEFLASVIKRVTEQTFGNQSCCICMDEPLNSPALLPCGHAFCHDCVVRCLQMTGKCPECRKAGRARDILPLPDVATTPALNQDISVPPVKPVVVATKGKGNNKKKKAAEGAAAAAAEEEEEDDDVPLAPNPLFINAREKLNDYDQWYVSSKMQKLLDDVKAIFLKSPDDKIIVFSFFVEFLHYVSSVFNRAENSVRNVMYNGGLTVRERDSILRSFGTPNAQGGPRVLLASITTCNVGLNLTMANHAFLMEPTWNPAVDEQAENRIHRIGQEKPVTITKYFVSESMDSSIQELAKEKAEMAAHCVDGTGGGRNTGSRIGTAAIRRLFAPTPVAARPSAEDDDDDDLEGGLMSLVNTQTAAGRRKRR